METEVGGDPGVDGRQNEDGEGELGDGDGNGVGRLSSPRRPPLDAGLVQDERSCAHHLHFLVDDEGDHEEEGDAPDDGDGRRHRAPGRPADRTPRSLHDGEVPASREVWRCREKIFYGS